MSPKVMMTFFIDDDSRELFRTWCIEHNNNMARVLRGCVLAIIDEDLPQEIREKLEQYVLARRRKDWGDGY
jgi:hypothetical protein